MLIAQVTSRCNFVVPLVTPFAPIAIYNFGPDWQTNISDPLRGEWMLRRTKIRCDSTLGEMCSEIVDATFTDHVSTLHWHTPEKRIIEFAESRFEVSLWRPVLPQKHEYWLCKMPLADRP